MLTIIPVNEEWANFFQKEYADSVNPKKDLVQDTMIVIAESSPNGETLQTCAGIGLALAEIRKDPSKRITIGSFLPISFLRKQRPETDVLLGRETVRFLRLPFSTEDLIDVWDTHSAHLAESGALSELNRREIGRILHSLRVEDYRQPKNDNERDNIHRVAEDGRKSFVFLSSFNDEQAIDFLFEANAGREEVRKGEFFDGVFCDIEGTLLVDRNVNQEVLDLLRRYEGAGTKITLWTDGNIATLSGILLENGISYPLVSKMEFAGAEVAIAIDDMDEFSFNARTKIVPRKFIRVS